VKYADESANGITVTRYVAYVGTYDGESGTYSWTGGSCSSSTTSCTFPANAVSASTYYVGVKTCDGSVCSAIVPGDVVKVWYLSPPSAPSLSGPSVTTTGSIGLTWSDPSTTTSFDLYGEYQSKTTGNWTASTVIYSGSSTDYTDSIAPTKAGASYYVVACNQAGCSGDSDKVSVTYSVTGGGGGGGGCGASCGGCGKVACFVLPDDDYTLRSDGRLAPLPRLQSVPVMPITPLPDLSPAPGDAGYDGVSLSRSGDPKRATPVQLASNRSYTVTEFAALPAPPPPVTPTVPSAAQTTLLALRQARRRLLGHALQQPSEADMQAAADRRAEAQFASLEPAVPAADRAAWAAWSKAEQRAYPHGPQYAPPEYLADADTRIKPADSTPYRFTVLYLYDDASGGLTMVANDDTGFIYWQAAMYNGNAAPVDAWGHVTVTTDGNGVSTVTTYDAATGAPTGISSGIGSATNVQNVVYTWNGYGNLQQRCDTNQLLAENFNYDGLNRLLQSNVDSGVSVTSNAPPCSGGTQVTSLSMSYDPGGLGNIASKSDVGTYTYDPSHPHAVQSISGLPGTYSYDADGNMVSGDNRTIIWSVDNLPTEIQGPNGTSDFAYGPDHQRYLQTQANGTDTTYIGGLYEVVTSNGGATVQYRHNIVADGQVIAVHTLDQSGNAMTSYLHYDHLGSVDAITDDTGAVTQRMSFDAFGQRRDPSNWTNDLTASDIASLKDTTDRGYTDQEQLDNVSLVHMNGRVYDPEIGRFISADPTVPDPMSSQAYNRYSYVYNSPLEYTDPDGFKPNYYLLGAALVDSTASYLFAMETAGLSIEAIGGIPESDGMSLGLLAPAGLAGIAAYHEGASSFSEGLAGLRGEKTPYELPDGGVDTKGAIDAYNMVKNPAEEIPNSLGMELLRHYLLWKATQADTSDTNTSTPSSAKSNGQPQSTSDNADCSNCYQLDPVAVIGSQIFNLPTVNSQGTTVGTVGNTLAQGGTVVFMLPNGQSVTFSSFDVFGGNAFGDNSVLNQMNSTDGAATWDGTMFGSFGSPFKPAPLDRDGGAHGGLCERTDKNCGG
jgi:RHS repeat-associated protein